MRRSMNKRLKLILTLAAALITVLMLVLMVLEVKSPGVEEQKTRIVGFENSANVQYQVFLKQNPLYEETSLGEDRLYLAPFIDYIKTNFQYNFNIERPADIKGDYEIAAIVEGYTNEEDKIKTIWRKAFVITPKTGFEMKDVQLALNKEINFTPATYESFATQISEATKLNIPVKVTVLMNINLQAVIEGREIDKSFAPAITIPLNNSYFEITKSGIEGGSEAIEDTKQIALPVNKRLMAVCGGILSISLLALIYLLLFVKGDAKADLFIKQLNRIFKTHGSRLVAVNNEVGTSFAMYYKLKAIDDLVRIADELGKPILYKYSPEPKEITKFYIHDDKAMYSFNLKDMLAEKDIELKEKEEKILSNSKDVPME